MAVRKLEAQLEELARLGIALAPGITVDDLLHSYARKDYEKRPFDLVLFVLGVEVEREPWGRRFSKNAWNFDTECVTGNRSYVEIAKNLVGLAGAEARVKKIDASVDFKKKKGALEMMLDGKRKRWTLEIDDDWADVGALADVMETLSTKTKRFYAKNNGQAMILFFLEEAAAKRINELAPKTLTPIISI